MYMSPFNWYSFVYEECVKFCLEPRLTYDDLIPNIWELVKNGINPFMKLGKLMIILIKM
jgi:hypothetical protein